MDWVLQKGEFFDLICTTDFSSYCFYPGAWRVEHLPLAAPDHPAPQAGNRLPASARWLFCGVPFHNRINWIDSIRHTHPDGLLIGPNWPSYRHPTQVSRKRISRETLLSLYKTMPITLSIGRRHNIANSAKISPSTLDHGFSRRLDAVQYNLFATVVSKSAVIISPTMSFFGHDRQKKLVNVWIGLLRSLLCLNI